ncbi:Serine/threonine-protein kinase ULK3 [Hypsibius exemplaris]|uniref:Serine/threonine-protein kinase ULK3 n=1 Tax=Hypsibius exemplaris TaxID=2072580 RepID=A0A1W0W893_HYPEX|nr:Serine/threonine-protein kinase ULK3 [Hypsibius exemplaris]
MGKGKALQFLRSKHIAHMDLKPKNILLSSSREPFLKIADFGFAQYLKSNDGASDLRGSPLYMAPEMFLSKVYDARVDLWSVGVILYECLFGRAPYSSRTIEELITKITDGSQIVYPTDVKISEPCRDLLQRLLKKDPNQRISFEQFFDHPWLDFEHFPSDEHHQLAMNLCKTAAELDKSKDYEAAVKKYLAGLEYLVPLLTYEQNDAKKRSLKEKVQSYMARTEELKRIIKKDKQAASVAVACSSNDIEYIDESSTDYLKRVFADQPAIVAALQSGCTAEYMESEAHFRLAVEYYEVAIERLIRFTKGMPPGEKKTKLQRQISDWLANAEAVNTKLKLFERDPAVQPLTPSPPIAAEGSSPGEASIFQSCRPQ